MFDFFWTRIDPLEQVWTSVRLQSTTIVVMIMQMFHCSTCFWLFLWSIACDFWMSCGSQNIAISRCSSIFQRTAGWCPGNLMLRNFYYILFFCFEFGHPIFHPAIRSTDSRLSIVILPGQRVLLPVYHWGSSGGQELWWHINVAVWTIAIQCHVIVGTMDTNGIDSSFPFIHHI